MKKEIFKNSLLTALALLLSLPELIACGGGNELDFKSVLDVDSDTVLSLGDSLSAFENVDRYRIRRWSN